MTTEAAARTAEPDVLLLPAGTRLLHIGPHKTGTTSLQSAFHLARRAIEAQGVHYAGRHVQPMGAAYAVTARTPTYANPTPIGRWRALVREIDAAGSKRVVISSEGFCDADDRAIRRITRDLGRDRLHVVLTLRPLASILPSQYQQFVQGGLTMAYEPWLDAMLRQPPGKVSPMFWHRHRHDALVNRWAEIVGRERVTVIVADDHDHDAVPRLFERLVGLREGTLVPEWNYSNRSLTRAEVALVRALNLSFRAVDVRAIAQNKLMSLGATELIKRRPPAKDEPRIVTPPWALDRAGEISRDIVQGIATSRVRVIGDLGSLARARSQDGGAARDEAAAEAWPEVVTAAAMGVLLAAGMARNGGHPIDGPNAGDGWPDRAAGVAAAGDPSRSSTDGSTTATEHRAAAAPIATIGLAKTFAGRIRFAIRPRVRLSEAWRSVIERVRPGGRSPSIHSPEVEVE